MQKIRPWLVVLLCWCVCVSFVQAQNVQLAADINETVVSIPVVVNGKPTSTQMVGTVFTR